MSDSPAGPSVDPRRSALERRGRFLRTLGRVFHGLTAAAALGWVLLLALVIGVLAWGARGAIGRSGFGLLFGSEWNPNAELYGAGPFIVGTLLTSALALLIAVPVGLGVALLLSELVGGRLRELLAMAVDLLAAVPSVIYGFWAYVVLVPFMAHTIEPGLAATTGGRLVFSGLPLGLDDLTASLVLAVMILPTVSAVSREAMRAVPQSLRESAWSLGATRWEAARLAVLKPARPGILGGILLGLGRALGETIAVAMVIGGGLVYPTSLFSSGTTLASIIADDFNSAAPPEMSALLAIGLILLGLSLAVNLAARALTARLRRLSEVPTDPVHGRARGRLPRPGAEFRGFAHSPAEGPNPALETTWSEAESWRPRVRSEFLAHLRRRRVTYAIVAALAVLCLGLALLPLASLLQVAVQNGGAAVVTPSFYTDSIAPACNPAVESGCQLGGIGPALQGTLLLLGLASAIAIPLGILVGIYGAEYGRNRFARAVSFLTEVMTGLPTILIGMFVFVLFLAEDPTIAASALSGGVALAILMLPLVIRTTEEALRAVPVGIRESALALGFPRHRVTLRVTLGCAKAGIVTGALLAASRAGGETAALLMTAQGFQYYSQGLGHPIGSLTLLIFTTFGSPYPNWQEMTWGATLVLLLVMLALGLVTRLLFRRHAPSAEAT